MTLSLLFESRFLLRNGKFNKAVTTQDSPLVQPDTYIFWVNQPTWKSECVVPENIHTHPMEGHWQFRGKGGLNSQIDKGKYEAKLEIPWRRYEYFLEPHKVCSFLMVNDVWPFCTTEWHGLRQAKEEECKIHIKTIPFYVCLSKHLSH